MTGFGINPPRAPMVDARGMVTNEWYRFFVQIQRIVGGPSDPFVDGYFLSAPQMPSTASADEVFGVAPVYNQSVEDAIPAPAYSLPPEDQLPPPPVIVPVAEDFLYPYKTGA